MAYQYTHYWSGDVTDSTVVLTASFAANAGDVILLCIEFDVGAAANLQGVSSSNVSWTFVRQLPHDGNGQDFQYFIGKVNTGFSADTEVITGTFANGSPTYRGMVAVRIEPPSGRVFASTPVQQHNGVVYPSNTSPTTTDGCTTALTTTGSNQFLVVGWFAAHGDSATDGVTSVGTDYTEQVRDDRQGSPNNPYVIESKIQSSAGAVNASFTCTLQTSSGDISVLGVALETLASGSETVAGRLVSAVGGFG